jgi:hypothetical protein
MMDIGLHDISGIWANFDRENRFMRAVAKQDELAKEQSALHFGCMEIDAALRLRGLIMEALDREQVAILRWSRLFGQFSPIFK